MQAVPLALTVCICPRIRAYTKKIILSAYFQYLKKKFTQMSDDPTYENKNKNKKDYSRNSKLFLLSSKEIDPEGMIE